MGQAHSQAAEPFFLMAGPNVIQSEEHIFKMCRQIKHVTDRQERSPTHPSLPSNQSTDMACIPFWFHWL
jgi:hypothetical protein